MKYATPSPVTSPARRGLALAGLALLSACATVEPPLTPPAPPAPVESSSPQGGVLYAWVQQGPAQSASARAITTDSTCPSITVDAVTVPMTLRATSPPNFSAIRVCEHALSSASPPTTLSVGGLDLPPPTTASEHVLVIGDTGCRIKSGSTPQPCTGDPKTGAWGFPKISREAEATAPKPDVILHVGDYLYRESGCGSDPDCGYKWSAWQADFFAAAETSGLLRQAPWILVRGNHESCSRAWHGYFLFFEPGPYPGSDPSNCPKAVAPYGVALDDLDVYVVDTSSKSARQAQTDFKTVAGDLAGSSTDAWLATHVPVWTNLGGQPCPPTPPPKSMAAAFTCSGLQNQSALKWLHVGHVHLFKHLDANAGHQAETITGGSGVRLDPCFGTGFCYGGTGNYSYLMVESQTSSWNSTLYNLDGGVEHTFSVSK